MLLMWMRLWKSYNMCVLTTARVGRNELRELRRMFSQPIDGLRRCALHPSYIL